MEKKIKKNIENKAMDMILENYDPETIEKEIKKMIRGENAKKENKTKKC